VGGSWEAEAASGGAGRWGRGASIRELVARRPAVGQGLVVLPSRSAAAAAPEQCQICDSDGAIHQSLGSALDQVRVGAPSPRLSWGCPFPLVFISPNLPSLCIFLPIFGLFLIAGRAKGGIFSRK